MLSVFGSVMCIALRQSGTSTETAMDSAAIACEDCCNQAGQSGEKDDAAGIDHTSTCSAIARASSTSIPRYRTVLSILEWPSNN